MGLSHMSIHMPNHTSMLSIHRLGGGRVTSQECHTAAVGGAAVCSISPMTV